MVLSTVLVLVFVVGAAAVTAFAPLWNHHPSDTCLGGNLLCRGVVAEYHSSYSRRFGSTHLYSTAATTIPRISSQHLSELNTKGVVVIENFIAPSLQQALREDVQSLRQSFSKFNVAKIGQDSTNALNTDIRVAETCFLGRGKLTDIPSSPARTQLYDILDQLRLDLPTPLDANLMELLYAYYPRGGFYRRHRDAIPGSASTLRKFSLLLYLNAPDWTPDNGGQLRMHYDGGGDFLPVGASPNYKDVDPRGGTLVLFQSDKLPHEVLDTQSERYAGKCV
jgi:SM-20-related protein